MPHIIDRQKPILIRQNGMIQPHTLCKRTILNFSPEINQLPQLSTQVSLRISPNRLTKNPICLFLGIHFLLKPQIFTARITPRQKRVPIIQTKRAQNIKEKHT
jgi:hypothetical protein